MAIAGTMGTQSTIPDAARALYPYWDAARRILPIPERRRHLSVDLRGQLQTSLGDAYRLERELGGGGMSRVFVAEEHRLQRKVVVKVLSPDLALGLSAERFEREIRMVAALQQANIV